MFFAIEKQISQRISFLFIRAVDMVESHFRSLVFFNIQTLFQFQSISMHTTHVQTHCHTRSQSLLWVLGAKVIERPLSVLFPSHPPAKHRPHPKYVVEVNLRCASLGGAPRDGARQKSYAVWRRSGKWATRRFFFGYQLCVDSFCCFDVERQLQSSTSSDKYSSDVAMKGRVIDRSVACCVCVQCHHGAQIGTCSGRNCMFNLFF